MIFQPPLLVVFSIIPAFWLLVLALVFSELPIFSDRLLSLLTRLFWLALPTISFWLSLISFLMLIYEPLRLFLQFLIVIFCVGPRSSFLRQLFSIITILLLPLTISFFGHLIFFFPRLHVIFQAYFFISFLPLI